MWLSLFSDCQTKRQTELSSDCRVQNQVDGPQGKLSTGSLFFRSLAEQPQVPILTLIEFTAQLVVGAPFHHLGDMLSFLVDRHGTDDSALWRWGHHLDLDGTCLCNLAVQFLQFSGILLREGPLVVGGKNQQEIVLLSNAEQGNQVHYLQMHVYDRLLHSRR